MHTLPAKEKRAYRLFAMDGKEQSYSALLENIGNAQVICFGELHNNPISHWIAGEVFKDLFDQNPHISLGLEMFERDQAEALRKYWHKELNYKEFKENGLWPNFDTDYKPLLDWSVEHGLPVIASNIPRRYARMVAHEGLQTLDKLPDDEKEWIAPLPLTIDYNLSSYAAMRDMMGGHGNSTMKADNFIAAQAIKDATMADSIVKHLNTNSLLFHIHGTYHSDWYQGIVWYIKHYQEGINIYTISTVEQENIDTLEEEHLNRANSVLVVPRSMTKTYYTDWGQ